MKQEDLLNRFSYHKVSVQTSDEMANLRERFHELARDCAEVCPESRELSLAITNLEQAMFWVNAGISRNLGEPNA